MSPSTSERQRKFMGAELARKRAGKKTKTGMSEKQLRDFAKKKEEKEEKKEEKKEEDLLKADMRYASGVDDFSMGAGGGANSATEVRHLRESTLERVRLFINHLGDGFSDLMRYWMDMERQFFTKKMIIRIVGDDGKETFPIIEKDDLEGKFDYKASVLPSIAGQQDIKKKQDMDLFQLLINLPFVDPQKLTQKVLMDWDWSLDSVVKAEDPNQGAPGGAPIGPDGQPAVGPDGQPIAPPQGAGITPGAPTVAPPPQGTVNITPDVAKNALAMLHGNAGRQPPQSAPMQLPGVPGAVGAAPMAARIPLPTTNSRGANRGGRVNTNTSIHSINSNPESQLMNRASSLQR